MANRHCLLLFAYLFIISSFTACDPIEQTHAERFPTPQNPVVALVGRAGAPEWPAIQRGAEIAAKRYPGLTVRVAEFSGSVAELNATIKDVLAAKPNVIAFAVDDPALARGAVEAIVTAGVPLITIGLPVNALGVYGHVDADLTGAAEILGKSASKIAGDRTFVLLHESGRSPIASRLYEQFKLGLRASPTARLLDERNSGVDVRSPVDLIHDMTNRYKSVSLVFSLTAAPWLDPASAKELEGLQFVTLPASQQMWPWLESGQALALVGPIDGDIGRHAVDICYRAIVDPTATGVQRAVVSELVTKEMLADFKRRYLEAIGEE